MNFSENVWLARNCFSFSEKILFFSQHIYQISYLPLYPQSPSFQNLQTFQICFEYVLSHFVISSSVFLVFCL